MSERSGTLPKAVEAAAYLRRRDRERFPSRCRGHILPIGRREGVCKLEGPVARPGYDHVSGLDRGAEPAPDGRGTAGYLRIVKVAIDNISDRLHVGAEPKGQPLREWEGHFGPEQTVQV